MLAIRMLLHIPGRFSWSSCLLLPRFLVCQFQNCLLSVHSHWCLSLRSLHPSSFQDRSQALAMFISPAQIPAEDRKVRGCFSELLAVTTPRVRYQENWHVLGDL